MDKKLYKYVLIPLIVILIAQRFFHLYTFIENPHSWRQLDTLFYSYDYYKHGIDLFRPSVSWMGGYKTVLLEFPILSAVSSFLFYFPGNEVMWMRILCLIIFLGSAIYLYKLSALFNTKSLSVFTCVAYLMIPLSIYYSRALIADFAVMLCCFATMYYYVRWLKEDKLNFLIIGTITAILGVVMKVPYMFIAYITIGLYMIKEKKIKTAIRYSYILIIPIIVFYFWQAFVFKINSQAPDWFFIPDYFKFVGMSSWYFGEISERTDIESWKNLIMRGGASVVMFTGIILFLTGLFINRKDINKSFFNFYSIGLILYLLIFLKLNFIHDYYQIPFISAVAFYIGVTQEYLYRKVKARSETKAVVYTAVLLIILSVNGIWFTERWYYKPDVLRLEAAEFIKENTSENDLIITSIEDTDPRDPRLNGASFRYGWAIRNMDLSPELIDSLKANGANSLIYIVDKSKIPDNLSSFLRKNTLITRKSLKNDKEREIFIYHLN